MRSRRIAQPSALVLLWTAIATYAAGFSTLSILRHRAFSTGRFDLGNMVQAVWSTAHGHPLQITGLRGDQISRLGAHFDPILAVFAPLWLIWPSPDLLLVSQAVAVALGALPVYWLARKHLGSEQAALGFALAYLLYPPTQWLTLNEFHPVALACPLLLFAIWYLDEDRLLPFAVFGLLAATTKEEIAFVVAGLGVWYAFSHRRRLRGAAIFVAGTAVALIAIEVVIPHFNRAGTSSFFTRYSEVGSTPAGIVHTALTDPWRLVTTAATGRGLGYLASLVLPLGLLVVLAPLVLIAALPELGINLLSAATTQTSIRFHYTAGLIPVLIAAAVLGAARISRRRPDAALPLATAAVVLGLTSNYILGPIPLWRYFPGGQQHQAYAAQVTEHDRIAARALKLIPASAVVSATNSLGAHLSARRRVLSFPYLQDARWIAALLLQTMRRPEPVPEPVARFTVALPAGDMPAIGLQPLVALSPDGRTLVYAARRGEMTALFRRDLATLEPSLIRGTEGGTAPFFSPDGRSLGFVANGELRRIPIAGGAAQTIAAAAGDVTATWTADDGIIFSTSATRVLHRVPASGGAPAALTTLNVARGDRLHLLPQPLPGNDALLFTIVTDSERQVAVLRRNTGNTSILTTGTHARYLPSGHVIFSRDDALWAAPFDAGALTLTGDPVLLLDGVQHSADQVAHLDVAADGSMAYLPAGDYDAMARRISWIDRNGRETPVGLETRPYVGAALSPDGSRIALAIREQGDTDIWVATPSRQTMTQLTAESANETMPVWSHDGTAVIFQSDRTGNDIYQRDAQGAGQTQRLTEQRGAVNGPHSLTPDGRVLLFGLRTAIAAVTPPSTVADTLVSGSAAMVDPHVSPNGRYLAFQSAESGRPDVFVADYPPKGARRWRISPAGGTHPRWGPDSNELFFLDQSGLMVAAVGDNPAMAAAGAARAWARPAPGGEDVVDYDVAPDGQRFLVILSKRSASTTPALIVVRNWLDEVRARLKPPR